MTNLGPKPAAAMLPNDERVRMEAGGRLLLFRNVIDWKFSHIVRPLAEATVDRSQIPSVRADCFFLHILWHEWAHALSSCFVRHDGRRTEDTIHRSLRERYSTIEECRADAVSIYNLSLLTRRGAVRTGAETEAAVTFVVHNLRTIRFGITSDYARAAAITLSFLSERGAIASGADGRIRIDPPGVLVAMQTLAMRLQDISTTGDYAAAGQLIDELGRVPSFVEQVLTHTTQLPFDLEFRFG